MKVREEDIPRMLHALDKLSGTRDVSFGVKTPSSGGAQSGNGREWYVPVVKYVNGRVQVSYGSHAAKTLVGAFQQMMDQLDASFDVPLNEAKVKVKEIEATRKRTMKVFESPLAPVSTMEVVEAENDLDSLDQAIQSIEI